VDYTIPLISVASETMKPGSLISDAVSVIAPSRAPGHAILLHQASIRQHTPAYASICQHTEVYKVCDSSEACADVFYYIHLYLYIINIYIDIYICMYVCTYI
jgi:hypothetical protein